MKKPLFALALLSLSTLTHAATYCGKQQSHGTAAVQIIDNRFDVWLSAELRDSLPASQQAILNANECVCVTGTIETQLYPDPINNRNVEESSFTRVTRVRASVGCQ